LAPIDISASSSNPAGSLVTPKVAKRPEKRTMTKEEYNSGLSVLDVRERIIYRLAGLVLLGHKITI
jgi:hypothetical protein